MCDYRKLILKPSTKGHARHDLLLSSLRKKIRFRPPFGGRLSHNGIPFFFNGRQNNGQTALDELLRERYRQIDLDQKNAAEKTRTVEEKLEGDVSAHRNKVEVSPAAHTNVFDYATLRKPRMQASPKRYSPVKASSVVERARAPLAKAAQSPGAENAGASTTRGKATVTGPAASGKPKKSPGAKSAKAKAAGTTGKMTAEGSQPVTGVKGAKVIGEKSTVGDTKAPSAGAKGPAALTTQGKGVDGEPKMAPSGVKGAKVEDATKATRSPGVKRAKSKATLTSQEKGTDAGTKMAAPSELKEAKVKTAEGATKATTSPGATGPASLTTQTKRTDVGTKVESPTGVKRAKKSPSPGTAAGGAPSGVKATKRGGTSATAKSAASSPAPTGTPMRGVKGAAVKTAPSTPTTEVAADGSTTRKSSPTSRQYGCSAATSRTKPKKIPKSAATGDTKAPSLRGSPDAGSKSPASLQTQPPSPQIAAGESTEFPVSPVTKLGSPTEPMMPADLSAAPGGDMKSAYTTPFSVKRGKYGKYTTVPASDADGLTTTKPCFSWTSATKQTRGPFSRPLTFGTPVPAHAMSQEEQIEYEKRELEIQQAWLLSEHRFTKTLPYPMRKPTYVRRPPALAYEQTRTFELRRDLSSKSKKLHEKPTLTLSRKAQKYIEPKRNLTQNLRYRQFKKQPIFTEFFDKCYNKYKKPPFRYLVNNCPLLH